MVEEKGNITPPEILLNYFDELMFIYNLLRPSCQILNVIHDNNSICIRIRYPYNINDTDISDIVNSCNNRVITIYNNPYLVSFSNDAEDIMVSTVSKIIR